MQNALQCSPPAPDRPILRCAPLNDSPSSIVGLLLAAGQARRFGTNKLLHPLSDGVPIAIASAHALMQALPETLVVVNAQDAALILLLQQQQIPYLAIHSDGLGESIAAGVCAQHGARGWVVALADMPFIRSPTIALVHQALHGGASIVAPIYRGQRGHPVGFDHRHKTALMNLRGDEGAKAILQAHAREIHLVDSDDLGVLRDVDTLSDLTVAVL